MTDRSKFEQMLEYLISEEQDKAKEIFHQLVVEKSREIYENILAEDFNEDEEVEEAKDEDEVEEGMQVTFSETDDDMDMPPVGDDDDGEIGGDATDDFMGDIEADGDDEMGGDEDLEDRVMDLEDALDDLRAEFEQMMDGDEGADDEEGGMDDMDDEEDADDEEDDEEIKDSFDVSDNFMREYIEKVTGGHGAEKKASGDNGDNVRSPLAGKNDMGGTTANIAKGGEAKGEGTKGGLLNPSTKEENFGNINVPGGNAGKTAFKKKEPGHGAEKKGAAESGADTNSPLNGAPKRAK